MSLSARLFKSEAASGGTVTETVAVLDQFGNPTYDEFGDAITTTTTRFVGGEEIRETVTYDVYGNRIAETDGVVKGGHPFNR